MAKPIYEHFDDAKKGRISRRDFFKRTAAAGAATAVITNYLDTPHAIAAPRRRFSLTRAAAQAAPLAPPAEGVDTSEALVFRGWN
ncbi:MAG: twin-arginine translocation signal domain-containing protein, partial [Thermomicrobiales bacterium]